MLDVSELPGHDLFVRGVADLQSGRTSEASLLVSLAGTRLRAAGLDVPTSARARPSHDLYDLLMVEHQDAAHARYNALLRRMSSFARAAEHAASR